MSVSSSPLRLHDEIVAEILKKATLKSLHRLKWVSKSWFALITGEVLPQLVQSPDHYIYYEYINNEVLSPLVQSPDPYIYEVLLPQSFLSLAGPNNNRMLEKGIRKSLDFLPGNHGRQSPNLCILDCCNGLFFCCKYRVLHEHSRYLVCNPVDKTYIEISPINPSSCNFLLDFNPLKSPHYTLVVVQEPGLHGLEFSVYQSEKQCFEKALVNVQHLFHVRSRKNDIALWNGYVYLDCGFAADLSINAEYKVMKISGVLQGAGEDISYKFIEFPEGSCSRNRELYCYMDTWRGKLRFVSISPERIKRIRVWALRSKHEDERMLEHDCASPFLGLYEQMRLDKLRIVGFHPIRNMLLISNNSLLCAYDFDLMSFEKFGEFENDSALYWIVFSFSPCFAKQVLA